MVVYEVAIGTSRVDQVQNNKLKCEEKTRVRLVCM